MDAISGAVDIPYWHYANQEALASRGPCRAKMLIDNATLDDLKSSNARDFLTFQRT